jgi:hypothetical protein
LVGVWRARSDLSLERGERDKGLRRLLNSSLTSLMSPPDAGAAAAALKARACVWLCRGEERE